MATDVANIMEAVCAYVISKVKAGETTLSSHQLENEGLRYVERVIGHTVNASTISRKWRLLKIDADAYEDHPLMFEPPFVAVKDLKVKTKSTEGRWLIVNINGTFAETIHTLAQRQLELFERK